MLLQERWEIGRPSGGSRSSGGGPNRAKGRGKGELRPQVTDYRGYVSVHFAVGSLVLREKWENGSLVVWAGERNPGGRALSITVMMVCL